jgi:hypothetical protein
MGTPLFRITCAGGGEFLGKMGYGRACMMLRCHGWGCKPPLTASHIHIGCRKSVVAPWDAVDGLWVHPYTVTPVQVGVDFREIGAWRSQSEFVVSCLLLLRLQNPIDCIPQPWHMYAKCMSTLICCGWAYGYTLMPLTGIQLWAHICAHLNYELRDCLITFSIFVFSQCLIARNVRKLFSFNCGISHLTGSPLWSHIWDHFYFSFLRAQ